ncbi:hypothetical protein OAD30_03000 [Alphaproteobacteria bacterium]|nr:hypothetical protein [Alphaproteobacteria bacterium]
MIFYIFQNTKFKISFSSNRLKLKPISNGVLKFALSFLILATGSAFTYYKIGNPFIDINKLNVSKQIAAKKINLDDQIIKKNKEKLNQLKLRSQKNPNDVSLLLELAMTASKAKNIEVEIESLKSLLILKNTPKIKSLLAQAIVRQAKGQITPEAKQLISKALEENPSDPGANFLSGLASSQIGNEKKAFDIWVKLYKNTSMNDPWMENLEMNIRTAANNIGISDDTLEKHLSKNIIMNPNINDEQINEMMSLNEKDQNARIDQMVKQLANRLTKKKEDLNGWLRLYNAYKVLNESKKAVNALKTAIKISPDNIKLKLILLKELLPASTKPNFTKEIERLITDILLLNPNNIDALFFKGLFALKNGNKINAIKIWQFLIEKLPKNSVMKLEILKKLNEIKK